MATLRVILDQMVAQVPGGIGRYTEELTRELILTAPRNCSVEGIVSSVIPEQLAELSGRLDGLEGIHKLSLGRRELSKAWQHGFALGGARGMIHAPSMLAPLRKPDREAMGEQVAITIHDVVPWTNPETLTPNGVAWHKAMAKRARKFADAVVVPTHAVAHELSEIMDFGDRIRVIGGAVGSGLVVPDDQDDRAVALGLPEEYVLSVGTLEPRKGLRPLIEALAREDAPDLPLVVVGPKGWGDVDVESVAAELGLPSERLITPGFVSDSDLALVIDRATVFVYPSLAEGFGLPLVEAMHFGTPVIHSDAPALVEVAADAGIVVKRDDAAGYPERLCEAIRTVVDDAELAERLHIAGLDRSRAFSWRDSAEKVWQLHADI